MDEENNNILKKIKSYFFNIFRKDVKRLDEPKNYSNKSFKENIIIPEDSEKIRLLKLQQEFEAGNILEEEIDDDDFEKLHGLYDEQIEVINNKIEQYKNKILKIKISLN